LSDEYDIAVIEIGTNEPGEIAKLSMIVEPTHGLITNIGKEHLEKLIDLDGVEMEETFLLGFLKKNGGKAFINYDDERLRDYYNMMDHKISYGTIEGSDVNASIEIGTD
jgi:UDP-N-acetylmuramyl pentapeptide synthase